MESTSNSLPAPPSREEDGWLLCPNCGVTYGEPQFFCQRCHYYSPSWWTYPNGIRPRSRWRRRILLLCLLFAFLGYLTYLCRSFIPNPIVILRQPTSKLNSLSSSGEWAVYAHNSAHTRYVPRASPLDGRVRWSLDLGESTSSAPAVKDGTLYVGGQFKVHAIEAATGRHIWETKTTGPVHSSPAVAGPLMFLGLLDGEILALERSTGDLRWNYQTKNFVFSSPTVVDGVLYTGSGDGAIYALDANTGQFIWSTQTGGAVLSAPTVKDGILYAPSSDRRLYSLSAKTGALRLRFRMYWSFVDSAVVANNLVYFVTSDGRLYTLRHGTREYPGQYKMLWMWLQFWLWRLPVPTPPSQPGSNWRTSPKIPRIGFVSSPAVTPEALYVGDRQGWFYAKDAVKAEPLWEFKVGSAILASPLVLGEHVYFGSEDGNLYALDRHKGEFLWKVSLGAPIKVSPVYAAGLLFVRTEDGRLYAVE